MINSYNIGIIFKFKFCYFYVGVSHVFTLQAVCCCVSNLKPRGSETWSEAAVRVARDWLAEPLSRYMQFEVVAKKNSLHAVNIIVDNGELHYFLYLLSKFCMY